MRKCWAIIEANVLRASHPVLTDSTFFRESASGNPGWSVPKYTSDCFSLQWESFRLGFKQYSLQAYFIILVICDNLLQRKHQSKIAEHKGMTW